MSWLRARPYLIGTAVAVLGFIFLLLATLITQGQTAPGAAHTTGSAVDRNETVTLVRNVNDPVNVALGLIEGRAAIPASSFNPDVGAGAPETVWPEGGNYTFQVTEEFVHVRAGDAGDHVLSTTGARTVGINCLDVDFNKLPTFVLALNGASDSSDSLSKCRHINFALVLDAGCQQCTNLGRIEIANESNVLMASIEIGKGQSAHSMRAVPITEDWVVVAVSIGVDSNQPATIRILHIRDCTRTAAPFSALLVLAERVGVVGQSSFPFPEGVRLLAGSCIFAEAEAAAGQTSVGLIFDIIAQTKGGF